MATDDNVPDACDVCGERIGKSPWLMLNRYALGTGASRCLSEPESDGYTWEMGDLVCTGILTHWPECTAMFIEAKMVETDVEASKLDGE